MSNILAVGGPKHMISDEASFLAQLADDVANEARDEFLSIMSWVGARCESPIERVLAGAITRLYRGDNWRHLLTVGWEHDPRKISDITLDMYEVVFYPQAEFGRYRVDFYARAFYNRDVAFQTIVECDGHEFHEKTKEQARRDKQRDRWFQMQGISVLRFAGSEIWADPEKCAEDVLDHIFIARIRARDLLSK